MTPSVGAMRHARPEATTVSTAGFAKEERVAHQFLVQAIHRRRLERLHFFGFQEPDILYYLPVREFVADAATWEELTGQRQEKKNGRMENVKDVAGRRSGRAVAWRRVKDAAAATDETPEFTELLDLCHRVSGLTNG